MKILARSSAKVRWVLREVSVCTRTVIVSMPLFNYPQRDLGEERLLSQRAGERCCVNLSPR
jgi:hypothetical protein